MFLSLNSQLSLNGRNPFGSPLFSFEDFVIKKKLKNRLLSESVTVSCRSAQNCHFVPQWLKEGITQVFRSENVSYANFGGKYGPPMA